MMLEIRLLGTFDLRQAGKSVAVPSRPAQSLLAYLTLNAGSAHRREKPAGMSWPDSLEYWLDAGELARLGENTSASVRLNLLCAGRGMI